MGFRKDNSSIALESSQFVSAASLRVRLDWFNKLRWGAAVGVLAAIVVATLWLREPLPLWPMLGAAGALLLMNLGYVIRNWRLEPESIAAELRLVKVQMFCDLLILTILLNLSGGIENPLLFLYVIHVFIASLLFKGREIFHMAGVAIVLFTGDVLGEYLGWLPHHHLLSASEMTHELPFILMTLSSFWLVILFSAYMGQTIMEHNRAIKDELVDRQRELMAADKAKMDFFRFVTHEIKSPVNTAQSALQTTLMVYGDDTPPKAVDLLNRGVARLEQATEIVKDLADLTRGGYLKRDKLKQEELNALVTGLVADQQELAELRGQSISMTLPSQPTLLTTDLSMVEKIYVNLISNAVRYNKDGGKVQVRLTDTGKTVRLQVDDEGIGVSAEDQPRIFDEFYRSKSAREMTTLGTGLGLPIANKFAQELGGHIEIQSEIGVGSRFTVELPRQKYKMRTEVSDVSEKKLRADS